MPPTVDAKSESSVTHRKGHQGENWIENRG